MYSYIYSDDQYGKGIGYFVSHQNENGIKNLVLENIQNLVGIIGKPVAPELQELYAALIEKDANKAIMAWNKYATEYLNLNILIHKFEPIKFID